MQTRALHIIALAVAAVILPACSDPAAVADDIQASIEISDAELGLESGIMVHAKVPVTLRNTGAVAFSYDRCTGFLEKKTGSKWQIVGWQICLLPALPPGYSGQNELAPGEEVSFVVRYTSVLGTQSQWAEPLNGPYRYGLVIGTTRTMLRVYSEPVELKPKVD